MKRTIALGTALLCCIASFSQKFAGTITLGDAAYDGLTLFAPLNHKKTYLIDNCGRVINSWASDYFPGNTFYLRENGDLVRAIRLPNSVITGGGGGGGIEMYNWSGTLLWSYQYNSEVVRQHHDISVLPNGNILMLAWVLKTREEAIAAGRDTTKLVDGVIWSEEILELKPVLPNSVEIVWRWELWDHMIQDFDPAKENFGIVADHPELVNLNFTMDEGIDDWIHANALDYNPELDQILISSPFLNEFWIIDHSTTTEEAASHAGGVRNKGGDILYRWGNPAAYNKGTDADKQLYGQHHVHWIKSGLPDEGKIMLFNNNAGTDFSTVDIINPPLNSSGGYDLVEGKFGPQTAEKIYKATPPQALYSRIMSGAELLPNGNILICSSLQGRLFEVTASGEVVWEYKNPVTANGIAGRDFVPDGPSFASDPTFRAIKLPRTFSAFNGRSLEPGDPVEGEPWYECETVTAASRDLPGNVLVYPNPAEDFIMISSTGAIDAVFYSISGQILTRERGDRELTIDISKYVAGIYLIRVNGKLFKIAKCR